MFGLHWKSGEPKRRRERQLHLLRSLSSEGYARIERASLTVSKLFLGIWDAMVLYLCLEKQVSVRYGGVFMWLPLLLGFAPYLLLHNLYVRSVLKSRIRRSEAT